MKKLTSNSSICASRILVAADVFAGNAPIEGFGRRLQSMRSRPIGILRMATFRALIVATLAGYFTSVLQAQHIPVHMSPESFDIDNSRRSSSGSAAQFGTFVGRRAVYLPSGLLKVKGKPFRDGTVDVDVASKPHGLFIGIAFRIESEANMEVLYLRPLASDTVEAVQYTPRLNGDAIWQLLNSNHDKASAHIPAGQWVHMKIVVRGRTCTLFLNASNVPTLTVTNLRRGDSEGGIGLWSLGGGGYFSNLTYNPFPGRSPFPAPPPLQRPGLLSDWELSPAFDAGDVDPGTYPAAI